MRIIDSISRLMLGFDRRQVLMRIENLESEMAAIRRLLESGEVGNSNFWLHKNRELRMDPNSGIFEKTRADFHKSRYTFACQYVKNKSVGDIACGTGYGASMLETLGGADSVTGVDIDDVTIKYANEKYSSERVKFLVSSADRVSLPDAVFDVIVSFETIEHLNPNIDLLFEFYRLLKPDGLLIISTPNDWPLTTHHLRTYNFSSFSNALSKYFKIVEMYNQNSGCASPYNHSQDAGIVETTEENARLAECFIATCIKR